MYTLLKPLFARENLLKHNLRIFTPEEFSRLFKLPWYKTKYFLERGAKTGLFIRLKKGLYTLKTDPPAEEEIANALYRPSYLSFEYALAYHNLIPEMPYQITSATTKPTRLFFALEKSFAYDTLKKEAYTGYTLVAAGTKTFLIAEPEKAMVDYLYFESLGKRPHNDRLNFNNLDKQKVLAYAKLFKRKSLIKLINRYAING